MSILHHGVQAPTTIDIWVNAQVTNRQYYWNTSMNRWDNVFFKVLPGYTDLSDPVPVLPTSPNEGYAFYDLIDQPLRIVYIAYDIDNNCITNSITGGNFAGYGFLKFANAPDQLFFYGDADDHVPSDVGTYTYTVKLKGVNTRGQSVEQFFDISFTRTT